MRCGEGGGGEKRADHGGEGSGPTNKFGPRPGFNIFNILSFSGLNPIQNRFEFRMISNRI
jgi:hypothetical protein